VSATAKNIGKEFLEKLSDDRLLMSEQSLGELMSVEPVVYGFDVGPLTLMHDPWFQAEIVEDVQITSIPNTHKWFMGMFALRGYLIPVFDVGVVVNESKPVSTSGVTLVVIGSNEEAAALSIATLPKRILPEGLSSLEQLDLPETIRPAIRDLYSVDETSWLDVDYPYLFELLGEQVNRSYDFALIDESDS